jgi:hypothetical protein
VDKKQTIIINKKGNEMQYLNKNAKQTGFLSIEVIGVLLVIVVGTVIAISSSNMLSKGSESSAEMNNISTLYANTKHLKSSSGYGTAGADLSSGLIAVGGVPTNMSVINGTIFNGSGGTVVVLSTGIGFTIQSDKLSNAVCNQVVPAVSRGGEFASTQINSGSPVNGEVTPAEAKTLCVADANSVTYTSAS